MAVLPSESKALIPAANTPICPKVIQLFVEHPTITNRIVEAIWNEDGTVTDAFKASIGLTVGGLAAPTNVSATDTGTSSVTVTWSPVTGAISYKVYRSLTNDSSAASLIGSPSAETFTDTSGTSGQTYWYFVKATNAGGDSDFSSGDSGHWGASAGTPIHYDSTQNVTVPAGWSTIAVTVYGAGGGGGGGSFPSLYVGGVAYGGGGGGGGGKTTVTGIVVATGNVLVLTIGDGGSAGGIASAGSSGQPTSLVNSSTSSNVASASGGNGGGAGGIGSAGAAGSGGSGGTTSGSAGSAGGVGTGGTGGTGLSGYGAGGNGGNTNTGGSAGSRGHIVITPNG